MGVMFSYVALYQLREGREWSYVHICTKGGLGVMFIYVLREGWELCSSTKGGLDSCSYYWGFPIQPLLE